MSQTFSGTQHLVSSAVVATAPPFTLALWFTTAGGIFRRLLALGNPSDANNIFSLNLDVTSGSNKLSAFVSNSTNNAQALTSVAVDVTGNWNHGLVTFTSAAARAVYLNGLNKATSSASITNPTGISTTVLSGRPTDFTGGISGQAAHAYVWSRAVSDTEAQYLGIGGNPRAIKGAVSDWNVASGESPVADQIGTNTLTASGPPGAGTTDPNFQTFMTNGPVGALAYTVGTAIASINVAGLFESVSSAFTVALVQLATPTQPTTTSSGLTATREIVVGSNAAFTAGDYCKVTSGGTPTRVLALGGSTILLVADDQTYTTAAQVFRYAVNPLTVAGLSISSGTFSGTPTAAATNALCFFRATCNALGTLMADSDVFTITTTGGGGGSGLLMPAGIFSGGFIGG